MSEKTLDEQIADAERGIARVLWETPVPDLMREVKEYGKLQRQAGYNAGFDDGQAWGS